MADVLFSHDDLDGAGCAVVFLRAHPDGVATTCSYGDYEQTIGSYLQQASTDDRVTISDLSLSEPLIQQVKAFHDRGGTIDWIDHHETSRLAVDGKGYPFAHIDTAYCATHGIWKATGADESQREFVETVNAIDLWKRNDPYFSAGEQLAVVYFAKEDKAAWIASGRQRTLMDYTPEEEAVYQRFVEGKKEDVRLAMASMQTYRLEQGKQRLNLAVCQGASIGKWSTIADTLLHEHGMDAAINLNVDEKNNIKTLSLRTREPVNGADIMTREFNGGGHPRAAGGSFEYDDDPTIAKRQVCDKIAKALEASHGEPVRVTTVCRRCRRPLRGASSVAHGMGATCAKK